MDGSALWGPTLRLRTVRAASALTVAGNSDGMAMPVKHDRDVLGTLPLAALCLSPPTTTPQPARFIPPHEDSERGTRCSLPTAVQEADA